MRTIPYRDVLWAAAYRIGLDPAKDFLQDQADALASYINSWIRRLYDSQDWPEWTKIRGFEVDPATNLVPYTLHLDARTSGGSIETLGRVFKVYLLNPLLTSKPFDTPFRLTPDGIWPGYEHGGSVWIKYIPQCPQFTATPWRSDVAYSKGSLVYVPTIGECYISKASNNLGHDPSFSFSPNPPQDPPTVPPPAAHDPPKPPITTEVIQDRTPDDPGLVGQTQIYLIDFDKFKTSLPIPAEFHIDDPPESGSTFYIDIFDEDGTLLGEGGPITANGVDTISAVMAALAADLQTNLGGTFTVTSSDRSVTVESASSFYTGHSFYRPALGYPYYFPVASITQSLITQTAGAAGLPQQTQLSLTVDQVSTGSIYGVNFRGPDGAEHLIQYEAQDGDSVKQILAGLTMAIDTAQLTDTYFENVDVVFDQTNVNLVFSTKDVASINADITAPNSPWWELQPMPFQLADPIIRGEVADVFREEGQTDRSDGEEKKVETELAVATGRITTPEFLPLTDQQKPKSRFAIK